MTKNTKIIIGVIIGIILIAIIGLCVWNYTRTPEENKVSNKVTDNSSSSQDKMGNNDILQNTNLVSGQE